MKFVKYCVFILFFCPLFAQAQVGLYGQFSAGKLNFPNSKWIYGPTIGAYFAQRHFAFLYTGIDVRGEFLGNGSDTVWNSGLGGLRLGLKLHAIPIQPYVEGLIGAGHAEFGEGFSRTVTTDFEYQALGGIDFTLLPHIDWRVVEFGYGQLPGLANGVDTRMYSTGIVVRLP